MGMYSYVEYEDLHTELVNELREWISIKIKENGSESYWYRVDVTDNGEVSLEGLDGYKIISYWYPEFIKFLKELALFIEGVIEFIYETHEEKAKILFDNGKFIIKFGTMEWEKAPMDDILMIHGEQEKGFWDISDKLKDLVMIGKL